MMGIVGYLHERESGSFRSSRFRRCKQNVKDWLERLSASPALNQVRIFILFLFTILVLVCYFLLVQLCSSSLSFFDLWQGSLAVSCYESASLMPSVWFGSCPPQISGICWGCKGCRGPAADLGPIGHYNICMQLTWALLLCTLWHYHCTNTVVVVVLLVLLHCHQFAVRSFFH